ncbi:TPA: V-type ATP synthase subunit I [archaeon]|uniref:A-type ATP synthase subunit I n=1 Tax=Candidatus Naiadarchaeum limnaeum TaxID=2756139 RepID=A0A832XI34_9ARCH|nr:V-type ATP synthase subunit I [Candidatus Naiadarchaeales archaeon SRR2090153.bin1042]HIK00216.1 V-type ATP synthase subunit I [Candidatus Naiadarchaeum limnaeum]
MIEPVRMYRVRIVGSKRVLDDSIQTLHSLGVVHIDEYQPGKYKIEEGYFDIGSPFERASKFSEHLVRVRSLIAALRIDPKKIEQKNKINETQEERLRQIEKNYQAISNRLKNQEAKLAEIRSQEEILEFLERLKIRSKLFEPIEEISIFSGITEEDFEQNLKGITDKYKIFKAVFGKKIMFALFVQKTFESAVLNLLSKYKYREIRIPEKIDFKNLADLLAKKKKIGLYMQNLNLKLEQLKVKSAAFLVSYEHYLKRENEKAEAPLRFATTSNSFFIDGYVPVTNYAKLDETFGKNLGTKIHIERSTEEIDFAPTELQNPKLIDAFEFFLNLYSLPFYRELDPTFLIFLTFPFFFGFMLGDVGYGIVTAVIFLIVKLKTKSTVLKGLMNAMILASVSSILFGFVFGEFFGGAHIGNYYELTPIISREHALGQGIEATHVINQMLLITILVGVIHVNIGFIMGFLNVKRMHGLKHAILEKFSWIVLETGAFLMLFQMYNFFFYSLPYQLYIGSGIVLIGLIMLFKGHGAFGLIEVPSVASNVLSYARLFAIGLSSVALAVIINEFATVFIEMGGIMFIPAILILVMGHGINIAIGVIGGFLQSLRLHYVEFFTKFYRGGGKRYEPFGR